MNNNFPQLLNNTDFRSPADAGSGGRRRSPADAGSGGRRRSPADGRQWWTLISWKGEIHDNAYFRHLFCLIPIW